ncbi:hypothetical protein B0H13DRAFT_1902335 [Mycena leptocephala]|nr:hypothetical protein B0H13DRAFT_1902335 [Mycena leptocephala]
MPSRSAPASPAPPRYTPREFIRNPIRGSPSPGTPLVSPLAPLPAGILNRNRKGSFGPEDPHPREGSAFNRIRTLADQIWVKHRRGEEPVVRPGSLVSPQTIYTGRERRSNGQETYHAVLMNARLLIHNPVTGEPGAINGHASVQLHAAPDNKRDWGLEVPYVSDFQIRNTLTKYGSGVHKEDETSENESEVSEGWRPSISPASAFPPVPETDEPTGSFPPASGYVTYPDGMPPPFDVSSMQEVGRTLTGDRVLRFPELSHEGSTVDSQVARPGTPRLPWQLLYDLPALRSEGVQTLNVVPDNGEDGPDGSTLEDWLPADPAMWSSSRLPMTEPEEMGNDRIERVLYDAPPIVDAPGSGAPDDTDVAHEEQEREEGEIDEGVQPLDPRFRSRADHVHVPAIGSGRRGALIGRDRYSSSPSVAATEFATEVSNSCAELLPVLRHSRPRSSWTAADFVAEAEELIDGVVNSVGSIPRTCSTSSPELVLAPPLPDPSIAHFTSPLASDPLFDLDDDSDNDSLPELVDGSSSDIASSSEENSAASGDLFSYGEDTPLRFDPERDPVARAEVLEGLREWGRQQARLQEGLRCSENRRVLRPLREGMDVLRSYLEDISIGSDARR